MKKIKHLLLFILISTFIILLNNNLMANNNLQFMKIATLDATLSENDTTDKWPVNTDWQNQNDAENPNNSLYENQNNSQDLQQEPTTNNEDESTNIYNNQQNINLNERIKAPNIDPNEIVNENRHAGAYQIEGSQALFEKITSDNLKSYNPDLEKNAKVRILQITNSKKIEAVISIAERMQNKEEASNKGLIIFKELVKSITSNNVKLTGGTTVQIEAIFQFEDPTTHETMKYADITYSPEETVNIKYQPTEIFKTETIKQYKVKPLETKANDIKELDSE